MRYESATAIDDPRFQVLQESIDGGRVDARDVFTVIEEMAPKDEIVSTRNLLFGIDDRNRIVVTIGDEMFNLHRNAVNQMVSRTGILTAGVAGKMMDAAIRKEGTIVDPWGQDLLLHNLSVMFKKVDRERVLVRSVPGQNRREIRGFLSDSYRRMSVGPIFQCFAETAISEFGAIPLRMDDKDTRFRTSYTHDLKMGFSMFLPYVFEPVDSLKDEFLVIGIMVENSDFGCGALSVSLVVLRVWCRNLLITQNELRKIHLGARLSANIQFSQETYDKDTETMASAVRDITRNLFSESSINGYAGKIRVASEQEIDADNFFTALQRGGQLLKSEEKEIKELYNKADIQNMPAGQTRWRAAQAISLFANQVEKAGSPERAMLLRHSAGHVLDNIKAA